MQCWASHVMPFAKHPVTPGNDCANFYTETSSAQVVIELHVLRHKTVCILLYFLRGFVFNHMVSRPWSLCCDLLRRDYFLTGYNDLRASAKSGSPRNNSIEPN